MKLHDLQLIKQVDLQHSVDEYAQVNCTNGMLSRSVRSRHMLSNKFATGQLLQHGLERVVASEHMQRSDLGEK